MSMRLYELSLSDAKQLSRTPWSQARKAEGWLVDHGYRRIGAESGYGSVWTDDAKTIVKVFNDDFCYKKFVEFCRRNRSNPHLPRFTKIYPIGENGGIVFSERLRKLTDIVLGMHSKRYFELLHFGHTTAWMAEFEEDNPDLALVLRQIAKEFPQKSACAPDLHLNNMMMRGDTLVIIDPVQNDLDFEG